MNVGDERVIIHIHVEKGRIVDTAVYGQAAGEGDAAGECSETDHSVEIDPDYAFRSKALRHIDMLPVLGPASLGPEDGYLSGGQLAVTVHSYLNRLTILTTIVAMDVVEDAMETISAADIL